MFRKSQEVSIQEVNLGGMGAGVGVGLFILAENIATQPSLAGAWAELGNSLDPGHLVGDIEL